MDEACRRCPAIAVPITVKIPEPITAPMPSAVRLTQPNDFLNPTSAFSESDNSWSMLLQRKRSDATHTLQSLLDSPGAIGPGESNSRRGRKADCASMYLAKAVDATTPLVPGAQNLKPVRVVRNAR